MLNQQNTNLMNTNPINDMTKEEVLTAIAELEQRDTVTEFEYSELSRELSESYAALEHFQREDDEDNSPDASTIELIWG